MRLILYKNTIKGFKLVLDMEIEFIENYNPTYPNDCIFVLKNFKKEELFKLSAEIDSLIEKMIPIDLSNLEWVKNLSQKSLALKIGETDMGILKVENDMYECILNKEKYCNMKDMIDNYKITQTEEYYWLYDINTEIDFLLSYTGRW